MGTRAVLTVEPINDPDGIALVQIPSSGGLQDLVLNGVFVTGGIAIIPPFHQVAITSILDDSLRTFTIYGEDSRGVVIQEAIPGANGGASLTTQYFSKVTRITVDDDTAAGVISGVRGESVSKWYAVNNFANPVNIGLTTTISTGAVLTYSVTFTGQDVQANELVNWAEQDHPDLNSLTGNDSGNFAFAPTAFRLKVTAFTSGSVNMTVEESF